VKESEVIISLMEGIVREAAEPLDGKSHAWGTKRSVPANSVGEAHDIA